MTDDQLKDIYHAAVVSCGLKMNGAHHKKGLSAVYCAALEDDAKLLLSLWDHLHGNLPINHNSELWDRLTIRCATIREIAKGK